MNLDETPGARDPFDDLGVDTSPLTLPDDRPTQPDVKLPVRSAERRTLTSSGTAVPAGVALAAAAGLAVASGLFFRSRRHRVSPLARALVTLGLSH